MNFLRNLFRKKEPVKVEQLVERLQTSDIETQVKAAESFVRVREFGAVDVVTPLVEAGQSALLKWESTKMVLSITHNVTPDQIVLAPHADPRRVVLAVVVALRSLTTHPDTATRGKAEASLVQIQQSIRDNWLARQVGF